MRWLLITDQLIEHLEDVVGKFGHPVCPVARTVLDANEPGPDGLRGRGVEWVWDTDLLDWKPVTA